jgi:hypothetical protein
VIWLPSREQCAEWYSPANLLPCSWTAKGALIAQAMLTVLTQNGWPCALRTVETRKAEQALAQERECKWSKEFLRALPAAIHQNVILMQGVNHDTRCRLCGSKSTEKFRLR